MLLEQDRDLSIISNLVHLNPTYNLISCNDKVVFGQRGVGAFASGNDGEFLFLERIYLLLVLLLAMRIIRS